MKIGIIGAGQIGGTLVRRLSALGHEVSIANSRGPETLVQLAAETGGKTVSVAGAACSGEVLIVAVPERNIVNLPVGLLGEAAKDLAIVDTGNHYPQQRDGRIAEIESGLPESRWVE